MLEFRARRWLAVPLGIAAALVFEDALVSWVAGAPERAWGLVALSPMRLGTFLAAASLLAAASWACATGVPQRWSARLTMFAFVVFGVFLGNGRYIGSNDIAATRLVPFMLGREGRLCFEDSPQLPLDAHALPYWFVPARDHIVSRYPVATGILALPAYGPAIVGSYDLTRERVHELERIAAAALALVSVLIIAAIARRWLGDLPGLAVAGIYAFGTNVATILSKALWQHSGGAFGFSLAIAGMLLARRPRTQALLIGLGLGIAVASRVTNAAPALFVGAAVWMMLGLRTALSSAAIAVLPVAAQLCYSAYYFGSITGNGYGSEATDGWTAPWAEGVAGILVSPGRGLLLYSPCLAFAAVALCRGGKAQLDRRTALLLFAAIGALVLVMGKWWCWWGGGSPGERMTSDVTPLWGVGLALAWEHFANAARPWRTAWFVSCTYACALQTWIAFVRPGYFTTEQFIRVMSGAWAPHAYAPVTYALELFGR